MSSTSDVKAFQPRETSFLRPAQLQDWTTDSDDDDNTEDDGDKIPPWERTDDCLASQSPGKVDYSTRSFLAETSSRRHTPTQDQYQHVYSTSENNSRLIASTPQSTLCSDGGSLRYKHELIRMGHVVTRTSDSQSVKRLGRQQQSTTPISDTGQPRSSKTPDQQRRREHEHKHRNRLIALIDDNIIAQTESESYTTPHGRMYKATTIMLKRLRNTQSHGDEPDSTIQSAAQTSNEDVLLSENRRLKEKLRGIQMLVDKD